MANFENFIWVFLLLFLSIAHLEITSASDDFELCRLGDINSNDGSLFFNISAVKSKGGIECRRLIHVDKGYVKLTINGTETFFGKNLFQVFDGGFDGRKINPKGSKEQGTYESSGNTMAILIKADKTLESSENIVFRGTFISLPFQSTCDCSGFQNGKQRCYESFGVRNCQVTCKNGFIDLTKSTGNFSCNLLNGKWDKGLEMRGFGCQARVLSSVVVVMNLTFPNTLCSDAIKENISSLIQDYFKANKNLSANGECFGQNKDNNCTVIECVEKNNSSFVSVTIEDKTLTKSQPVKEKATVLDLYAVYNSAFKGIEGRLFTFFNNTLKNNSQLNKVESSVKRRCPTGMFLFLTAGDIGHPVCSKCPPGFIYRAFKCEKCPNGTSSVQGSETCSLKEGQKINPSSKDSCKIYCQVGKGMDLKTGFCQWCPYHTYQNRTDVPNVNCSACPEGKKTPYPGTIDIDQCYVPCQTGTFFSLNDQKCLSCPSGTYQETKEHLYTRCKNCDQGKVTYSDGSADPGQCVPSCAKGHYLDSETSQCLKCPYGSYQDKINQLNCTRCFVGGSTLKNGSSEQTDCVIKCQKGTYFDEKERRCLECPAGTYMDQDGHLIFSCIKCARNKTTQSHSAVNESQCLDKCDSGEYFSVKNKSCELCPLGTFMDKSGHLIPSCKQCGGKKTTYEQGATNENLCNDECTVGNYFNSTTSSCMACPKGSYQFKTAQKTCLSCPPGLSTRSPGETSKLACVKFMCGPGKFINSTGECQACPKGAYQSAVNHTLSSCQQCPSKMSNVQGATNPNSCIKICDAFPCENGVKCIEKADAYCECPRGLTGKRCEVIENREVLVKLEIALRFISLNWSKELSDKTRSEYRITKYRIEKSLRIVFEGDESFVGVQVNEFVKGSVIANFDLYTNESASLVPAKTLQTAVRRGSIGGLPVDAEYLRIKQATCDRALGMEGGGIKDGLISATSESDGQEAKHGRLNSAKGWLAKEVNFTNYIQVSFNSSMNVTAIATQGDAVGSFVTAYSLSFRKDGGQWMSLKETANSTLAKNFTGNNDTNTVIKNILPEPITSVKDIRVIPVTWSNGIGMRIEFYGCISDPVLSPTEIPTQGTEQPTPTTTGPNVEAVGSKEDAYSWGKYLGITFGLLMVVGCLIAFFMWWRSAKKKQREKAPLVMTKLQGSEYQVIDKDDEDLGYDEAAV